MLDSYEKAGDNIKIGHLEEDRKKAYPAHYTLKRREYSYSNNHNIGRLYGVGFSLQNFSSSLRALLLTKYVELELVTSVPTILLEYAVTVGLEDKTPLLKEFVLEKDSVFQRLYWDYLT